MNLQKGVLCGRDGNDGVRLGGWPDLMVLKPFNEAGMEKVFLKMMPASLANKEIILTEARYL